MENPVTWGLVIALVGIGVWLAKLAFAFGKLDSSAADAKRAAESARTEADGFSVGLAALNAAFNLFQVTAAEKYITRDLMKEFEDRLTVSRRETTDEIRGDIKDLRDRMEKLSDRNGRADMNRQRATK